MTTPFAITVPANNVTLHANRQGEVSFTVTNTGQRPLRGRARVIPLQGASAAWFTLVGEPEREFGVASTQQFTVQVQIPPTAPAGSYLFRLDVIDVDNPDEHSAEGPAVALVTPTPLVVKKRFPIWVVLVVVALVIVGLLAGLFLNREEEPPADTSNPIPTRNIPNPIRTIRPLPTLSPFSLAPVPERAKAEGRRTEDRQQRIGWLSMDRQSGLNGWPATAILQRTRVKRAGI